MEYTITHSINESVIYFQVIHNKTGTYYESFIENTDMIWLGSEECKDDIPDNLIELARK